MSNITIKVIRSLLTFMQSNARNCDFQAISKFLLYKFANQLHIFCGILEFFSNRRSRHIHFYLQYIYICMQISNGEMCNIKTSIQTLDLQCHVLICMHIFIHMYICVNNKTAGCYKAIMICFLWRMRNKSFRLQARRRW